MSEAHVDDLWTTRALPMLRAIATAEADAAVVEAQGPRPEDLANATGQELDPARLTLQDLWDDDLITGTRADTWDTIGWYAFALRLTPKGRRALGQWPSHEGRAYDVLVEVLTAMLESEQNPREEVEDQEGDRGHRRSRP